MGSIVQIFSLLPVGIILMHLFVDVFPRHGLIGLKVVHDAFACPISPISQTLPVGPVGIRRRFSISSIDLSIGPLLAPWRVSGLRLRSHMLLNLLR